MNAERHLAWLKAEVRRTRDRVEDFERSMRGRTYETEAERSVVSLSLRLRWNAQAHAKRKLDEFRAWLDAPLVDP